MTSREAAIYNLKKLKGRPLKEKITYILTYFWAPITAVLATIVVLVSLIVHWASIKPTALILCCINSSGEQTAVDDYLQEFAQAQGIDTEAYELESNMMFLGMGEETSYQHAEIFSALLMSGNLDAIAADRDTVVRYAYQEAFMDVRELLTPEQLEALEPYFLYIDLSRLEEMDEFSEDGYDYPDPTKPEEMAQPVPVAITLQPEWDFTKACYPYTSGEDAVGLSAMPKNAENAQAFLQYILGQEEG